MVYISNIRIDGQTDYGDFTTENFDFLVNQFYGLWQMPDRASIKERQRLMHSMAFTDVEDLLIRYAEFHLYKLN